MAVVTVNFLKSISACHDAVEEFKSRTNGEVEAVKLLRLLIKDEKYQWANWLIVRVMSRPQYLAYAVFAAEQVLDIFEKKYPEDKRPRMAIEAAKKVVMDDTTANREAAGEAAREAAREAAWAAWASRAAGAAWAAGASRAAGAAWAAWEAAGAAREAAREAAWASRAAGAAWAAWEAAGAARESAWAAGEAAGAAWEVAGEAAWAAWEAAREAAWAAWDKMMIKILKNGIKILKED
jgi:hypothetical protein